MLQEVPREGLLSICRVERYVSLAKLDSLGLSTLTLNDIWGVDPPHVAGLSLKRDPVDRDPLRGSRETSWRDLVMDRPKNKWTHFSIAWIIVQIQAAWFS